MDINVIRQAAEQYNLEFNQNIQELQVLENILKENYNKYIDSLTTYLDKCKFIEDNRNSSINSYGDKSEMSNFAHLIPNNLVVDSYKNGRKYILDNSIYLLNTSLDLVNAMSIEKLLSKKVL